MRPPAKSAKKVPASSKQRQVPVLGSAPSSEALLDAAVEYTFPASDPIAVQSAFDRARKREPDTHSSEGNSA